MFQYVDGVNAVAFIDQLAIQIQTLPIVGPDDSYDRPHVVTSAQPNDFWLRRLPPITVFLEHEALSTLHGPFDTADGSACPGPGRPNGGYVLIDPVARAALAVSTLVPAVIGLVIDHVEDHQMPSPWPYSALLVSNRRLKRSCSRRSFRMETHTLRSKA